MKMYPFFKNLCDVIMAAIAFLLLLPLFVFSCLLLMIVNRGTVFFTQERPGKHEKLFKIIKFKTMRDLRPNEDPHALNRITKVGGFIRKYSIDEIPQLINVIKGDMSIVGPRPLLVKYLPLYNETQKQRHLVKPGITGWAQVKGRNAISWEQKFDYDVYYVNNRSFVLDIKIIGFTIKKVLLPTDINSNTNVNMPEFTGTK